MKQSSKFFKFVGLLLVMGLLFAALPTGQAQAQPVEALCTTDCYVDANSGLDTNLGNVSTPFKTIEKGVLIVSPGGTVHVAAGTYDEENILINKGINLLGAGATNTFIAPSVVTNNSTLIVQSPSGNVTISGFDFVMRPKITYGSAILVTGTGITVDSAIVTISDNVVTGSNDGSKSDSGFYGQVNNAKVVITRNLINKTGDNPIIFEQQAGSTTVYDNDFYIVDNPDYNPYFSMAYAGLTVSTPQVVEANTFHLDHAGSGFAEAITFDTAVKNSWSDDNTDTGHYTNILVKNNLIYTGGPSARGIGLYDLSAGAGLGTINGAVIMGNQIIGENLLDAATYGVTLRGGVQGAQITNNSINNINLGFWIRPGLGTTPVCPSGNTISGNQITSVVKNVQNDCISGSLNVSRNWWGSTAGPAAGSLVGNVSYIPWCGDAACSFFVSTTPVAQNQTVTTAEDTAANITLVATDADGDALTYSIVALPAHGTAVLVGNVVTYTPALNYNGPDSFTFKANDTMADSNLATVTISVTPVKDDPLAVDDAYVTPYYTTLSIIAPGVLENDKDLDGDTKTATLVTDVSHGTLSLYSDGSFEYTPAPGFAGRDTFVYQLVTYPAMLSQVDEWTDEALVTITVTPAPYIYYFPLIFK